MEVGPGDLIGSHDIEVAHDPVLPRGNLQPLSYELPRIDVREHFVWGSRPDRLAVKVLIDVDAARSVR
jgi:hypothetical protein